MDQEHYSVFFKLNVVSLVKIALVVTQLYSATLEHSVHLPLVVISRVHCFA